MNGESAFGRQEPSGSEAVTLPGMLYTHVIGADLSSADLTDVVLPDPYWPDGFTPPPLTSRRQQDDRRRHRHSFRGPRRSA
jgi:hypothetical protein